MPETEEELERRLAQQVENDRLLRIRVKEKAIKKMAQMIYSEVYPKSNWHAKDISLQRKWISGVTRLLENRNKFASEFYHHASYSNND